MITVFTPTYNRAGTLQRLYESLKIQSCRDFEWLIVDDGSTDSTRKLVETFINEKQIDIIYHLQPNGGKHRAINAGARQARGEWFFIVDSDDCLTPDAIEWAVDTAKDIAADPRFVGFSGVDRFADGIVNCNRPGFGVIDCSATDFRNKHGIAGDMSEVFRTSAILEHPFPEYPDEKFCPEALVWNRISKGRMLRYTSKPVYICEYQPDGLTAAIVRLRRLSPMASADYYSEYLRENTGIKEKIKTAINLWRFTPLSLISRTLRMAPFSLPFIIPGYIYRLFDRKSL